MRLYLSSFGLFSFIRYGACLVKAGRLWFSLGFSLLIDMAGEECLRSLKD